MTPYLIWFIAYFLGSIPFGLIISKLKKVDLRQVGSGNIGATNALRTLGKTAGFLTLAGDTLKGYLAVFLAVSFSLDEFQIAVTGLMAFIGHVFSIFLKFRGGKGVATALGIFLYLLPHATLCAMLVFIITLWGFHFVSLSSIVSALTLPLFAIFFDDPLSFTLLSVFMSIIIVIKHQSNIERLIQGEESIFRLK